MTNPFLPSSPCYDEESAMRAIEETSGVYDITALHIPECHHYMPGRYYKKYPDNFEDYVLASQIAQAEGMKFMVESFRIGKGRTTGVIWWNIIDAWP